MLWTGSWTGKQTERRSHDPNTSTAFCDEIRSATKTPTRLTQVASHINDPGFAETAPGVFDGWVRDGIVLKQAQSHGK